MRKLIVLLLFSSCISYKEVKKTRYPNITIVNKNRYIMNTPYKYHNVTKTNTSTRTDN